ncbi:hypothetical protein [Clavibacter californiensis]|uniref:Uncharacterized protein n=1 Tax=Clavibacter californiensis TaxID=1401995 RepID=A0ABX9NAK1_9MICO|nr:hypothetical protein [Clavibacter californiensis]PPF58900.1 hypothetical protein C5C13_07085 [Clavibacter michiganensis]RII94362.1 hypothetical protein DZF98_01770 [Clavibacter californiensis]UKF80850.1 hypothetical protein FGD68_04145 [Clavibacter californiensis]
MIIALSNVILISGVAFGRADSRPWISRLARVGVVLALVVLGLHLLEGVWRLDQGVIAVSLLLSVAFDAVVLVAFSAEQFTKHGTAERQDRPNE